jgi:hypothetical protein
MVMPDEEQNRRAAERAHDELEDFRKQNNEAAIRSGEVALKTVLLVNGGAAVAILAFLGAIASRERITTSQLSGVASTIGWFAAGVALGVVALAFAYLTNLYMANTAASKIRTWVHPYEQPGPMTCRYRVLNVVFHTAAILLGLASLAAFVWGVIQVQGAIVALSGS